RDHAAGHGGGRAADRGRDPAGVRDRAHRALLVRHRTRRARAHPRLPRLRERDLRPGDPRHLRLARHRRGRRVPRRARDRPDHGGGRRRGAPRARLDRGRPAAGAARMTLIVLLAVPLVGALVLWRASGSRATVLHGLTSAFTLAAALGVAVQVNSGGPLAAVDGLLRADALSAWMIALIGVVAALAATEAPAYLRPHALGWTPVVRLAPGLARRVIELAFVFLVVGYGTKAGLAPMHTWLPDAHSEAPAPVSALMSGVLLSVGVYAVLRFKPVVDLAAGPEFARRILLALGLVSIAVAAAFLWTSTNYKRTLAYSSVEHIGLVCLGLGFGGVWGTAGALLHIAN